MSVYLTEYKENYYKHYQDNSHLQLERRIKISKGQTFEKLLYCTTKSIEAPLMLEGEFLTIDMKLELIAKKIDSLPLSKEKTTFSRKLECLSEKYAVKKIEKENFDTALWTIKREISKLLAYKEYVFTHKDGITPRNKIEQLRAHLGRVEAALDSLSPRTVKQVANLAKECYIIPSLKRTWPTSFELFTMKIQAFFCCCC